ncbi:MAG: methyltransferase domain-containing protein [Pseudomonadota bacterium]|nr:methyltransferase domain-containing protein [Pseudomonadota bacterium]
MNQATSKDYENAIIDYYDNCEIDYKMLWRLDRCMAMHFGYWDETTKGVSDALLRENQVLAERVGITAEDRVLDAGCGVGGSSIWLAREIGCSVTGITLSQQQVDHAATNANKHGVADKVTFERRDFINTGYPDASFDVVWGVESVCHAENKADFIREAFRILKPGGRLVVADFFFSRPQYAPEETEILQEWISGWSVQDLEYSGNFRRDLDETGFVDVDMEDATEHVKPSAKRLYQYAALSRWGAKILLLFRIRNRTQDGNIRAVHRQWLALQQGLWQYGIFSARKPA